MDFTLHQLHIFIKVVELKSITRAAEAMHLTQPAVSIQLKNLQDQFSIPLIEVISRKVYITEFGKEVAVNARKILEEVDNIRFKADAFKGKLSGRLKVSIVLTAKYVMPYFLAPFLNQHQGLELSMDVTNKRSVLESLEDNSIDFALVSIVPEDLSINRIDLMENKFYLVGPGQGDEAPSSLQQRQLKKLPFIFRESGSGTRQIMEQFLDQQQLQLRPRLVLTSNEAVKQAILSGLGYSIMPLIGLRDELQNGDLQVVKVKGLPISSNWSLIWLKRKRLSPASEGFIEWLKAERSKIVEQHFSWYKGY